MTLLRNDVPAKIVETTHHKEGIANKSGEKRGTEAEQRLGGD